MIKKKHKNKMKNYIKYILNFIIFLTLIQFKGKINNATIPVGKAVVKNECSSLGQNNPLRLLDCSIFKLDKGLCCLLTITTKDNETDCEDEVCSSEEIFKTACIILSEKDSKVINETAMKYKALGDVLIECSQDYISNYIILITLIFFIFSIIY